MDVPAVPGEQEVHLVSAGKGDVRGVAGRARWNQPGGKDPTRQFFDFVGNRQHRQCGDGLKPCMGGLGISLRSLAQDFRRDVEFKILPPRSPPFPCGNLLPGNFHVSARPSRQQAGDRGFDIYGRFHSGSANGLVAGG